jgi:hypothetical protein
MYHERNSTTIWLYLIELKFYRCKKLIQGLVTWNTYKTQTKKGGKYFRV